MDDLRGLFLKARTHEALSRIAAALQQACSGDPEEQLPKARARIAEISRAYPALSNGHTQTSLSTCLGAIEELHRDRAQLHRILFLTKRIGEYVRLVTSAAGTITEEQTRQCLRQIR